MRTTIPLTGGMITPRTTATYLLYPVIECWLLREPRLHTFYTLLLSVDYSENHNASKRGDMSISTWNIDCCQAWIHIAYATPSHTLTSTPLLDYSSIKVHRVFLSQYHSLTYLHTTPLFLHHLYVTQTPICSILHAGRYLNDKEICYLGTVILTANVYHFKTQETLVTYQLQSFNIYFWTLCIWYTVTRSTPLLFLGSHPSLRQIQYASFTWTTLSTISAPPTLFNLTVTFHSLPIHA